MKYAKDDIKQLIGQSRLDEAIDILIEVTNKYLSENNNDKFVAKISDALLINSGKVTGLMHDKNLFAIYTIGQHIIHSDKNAVINGKTIHPAEMSLRCIKNK